MPTHDAKNGCMHGSFLYSMQLLFTVKCTGHSSHSQLALQLCSLLHRFLHWWWWWWWWWWGDEQAQQSEWCYQLESDIAHFLHSAGVCLQTQRLITRLAIETKGFARTCSLAFSSWHSICRATNCWLVSARSDCALANTSCTGRT